MEKNPPDSRMPQYKVGDEVVLVSSRRTLKGVVEIVEGSLERVHHYQIRFPDGTWSRYSAFELELISRG
jgi:ribosomal protein L19